MVRGDIPKRYENLRIVGLRSQGYRKRVYGKNRRMGDVTDNINGYNIWTWSLNWSEFSRKNFYRSHQI